MATFNASQDGNWSEAATWGGAGVPGVGDSAIINGYTVDLDQDVEIGADGNDFKAIQISNGKLKFPRNASRVLTFEGYFEVLSGGHLDIGDENDPILDGHTATLNFKRTSLINNTTLAIYFSSNGIITCNAEKGQSRYYTTLEENITAGDNIAVLTDIVDVLTGDEVYIMGTEDNGQGEKMIVQTWNAATKTVTFTGNFAHDHAASENTYCVILTRPIVFNKKSHTYGGNITIQSFGYDPCNWQNLEIKGLSDVYGANGSQYTYTKYTFCDYSDYGWIFKNCCLNETNRPTGKTGNTFTNLVCYRTAFDSGSYIQSIRAEFYHGYIFALNSRIGISLYDAVVDLLVSDDYSSGADGWSSGLVNNGIFGDRSVIKKWVISGDQNTYYSPRFETYNIVVLKLDYGYPLQCLTSMVSWHPTYQASTIRNAKFNFNSGEKWLYGSANKNTVIILQDWEKNSIPQADTVFSPRYNYGLDASVKKNGSYSIKATVTTAVNLPAQLSTLIPTSAGKLLTVSGFWRHNGNFVNRPTLRLTESGFNITTEMPAAANEWHPFVLSGVADFDGFAKLQLVWHGDTVGGEWWIDNITINSTRIDLGGMEFFGDNIFPPVILKTELDAADILRQSIASYTDSGTVGEALNELALLRKLSKNKREIDTVNNQIVFYDDDGTTELLRINIYNAAGDPAYKNITKWVPV